MEVFETMNSLIFDTEILSITFSLADMLLIVQNKFLTCKDSFHLAYHHFDY